jgi:PAS domain
MKTIQTNANDFFGRFWEQSWTYIKTVVEVAHEPILILDKDLKVMAANEPFYQTFQVEPKNTEGKLIYKLGNNQWNIPALRKLLENILPKHTFFKGFEVAHDFPAIGHKVMILNARQIYYKTKNKEEECPPIIMLAIEDVTEMMAVGERLAVHMTRFEDKLTERTAKLAVHIENLQKEILKLKKHK